MRTQLSDEERQDPDSIALVGALCSMKRGNAVRKYLTIVKLDDTWGYEQDLLPLMLNRPTMGEPGSSFLGGLSPSVPSFRICPREGIYVIRGLGEEHKFTDRFVRYGAAPGKVTCIVSYKEANGETRYGVPLVIGNGIYTMGGPMAGDNEAGIILQRLLTYAQCRRDYPDVTFHPSLAEYI